MSSSLNVANKSEMLINFYGYYFKNFVFNLIAL